MVNMNMIVNSSDLVGYEAETKINSKRELGQAQALNKLLKIWEGRQAKSSKKAAGLGLLAVTLAACNSDDSTPFAQTDIDTAVTAAVATAVAAVDLTTDNAAAVTTALSPHATLAAAVSSNDATVTTAALTTADGTIYASVDAAKTAGVNTTSSDAVTAALTSTDGTVHTNVDAAITSNDVAVTAAATTAATTAAETTLMTGTGFASVSSLLNAYNTASASVVVNNATLTTAADTINGTAGNDTITATELTFTTGDIIVDASSADADVLTITTTGDVAAVPTIAGIETVNFNLNAITTAGVATSFQVDTNGITAGATVNIAVTKASSTVTGATATNIGTGVTIASDLTMTSMVGEANADITLHMNSAAAQTLTAQTGLIDNLTIVSTSPSITLTAATAEEITHITSTGAVTTTQTTPGTSVASLLDYTVVAGGLILMTDSTQVGSASFTTTSGNITVTDSDFSTTVVAHTSNGDVTLTDTADAATSVTATAIGDGSTAITGADGDVTLSDTSLAELVVANGTAVVVITDAEAADTLTLTAGSNSTVANKVSDVQTLNLASNSTAATPITFTVADGDGNTDGTADGLIEIDNINFTGANSVTLLMSMDNMQDAAADASHGTAAAVIATDTMTGGLSRIQFNLTAQGALDVSKLAVDEIAIGHDTHANDTFTVASGQKIVIAVDQTTEDVAFTAPAVAGNTLTLTVENDLVAGTVTGDMAGITTSQISNLIIEANDPGTTPMTTGAINVGTANTVTLTGAAGVNVNGAVTAGTFNAGAATGAIAVTITNAVTAFTMGNGNDTLTSAGATALNIDGGAGTDTLVLAAADYSGAVVSLSNIETINVDASGVTLAASAVTGGSYVIVGDNGQADTLAVNAMGGTGETVDLSNTASTAKVTITGSNGADNLTGSSTTASFFVGGTGSDTIVGGAGVDTVTLTMETGASDTVTLGGGSDVLNHNNTTAATIVAVNVTDFNSGTVATVVDLYGPSVVGLEGLTGTLNISDTGSTDTAAGDGTVVTLTADNQVATNADLVVLSQNYATDALAQAGMATAGSDTFTTSAAMAIDDSILIAYYDGTNTNIAVATFGAANSTSNSIDNVATILILQGADHTATLDSTDLTFVA
jgi:hypothetical protein